MPLFEYRCSACGKVEEVLQKLSDGPPAACSFCGKKKTMSKLMSLTSFQLKGGGWYKDLYSSAAPGSENKTETSPAPTTPTTTDATSTSTTTTPATTTTTASSSTKKTSAKKKASKNAA